MCSATMRRAVVIGALAAPVLAFQFGPGIVSRFRNPTFDFEPLKQPRGFRRIAAGEVSSGANPWIGLTVPGESAAPDVTRPISDLCTALFGEAPASGIVPIAYFSDYNCPYCRVLTGELADLEQSSKAAVRITWHEWPLLGPTSEAAARAALAADMQGAYAAFHQRLMRTRFAPTATFLESIARDIDVDPDQLARDMDGESVRDRLDTTNALARMFQFPGTPALVVGRTVVVGSVSKETVTGLVNRELEDGPVPVCAGQ